MRYEDDPRHFEMTALALLREHAPLIAARIDVRSFSLTRPLDLLQGAITPTVRQGYARLDNGRFAIAIGDVHVLNDPLIAQGGNTASHAAWALARRSWKTSALMSVSAGARPSGSGAMPDPWSSGATSCFNRRRHMCFIYWWQLPRTRPSPTRMRMGRQPAADLGTAPDTDERGGTARQTWIAAHARHLSRTVLSNTYKETNRHDRSLKNHWVIHSRVQPYPLHRRRAGCRWWVRCLRFVHGVHSTFCWPPGRAMVISTHWIWASSSS